ncbi:hypothetical protein BC830DRAFT_1096570 [Chytriomyces sp. MP71]|nr:hypothetical protein BC830DRAFT_1096570 [Chytriomyces sp. MP71]
MRVALLWLLVASAPAFALHSQQSVSDPDAQAGSIASDRIEPHAQPTTAQPPQRQPEPQGSALFRYAHALLARTVADDATLVPVATGAGDTATSTLADAADPVALSLSGEDTDEVDDGGVFAWIRQRLASANPGSNNHLLLKDSAPGSPGQYPSTHKRVAHHAAPDHAAIARLATHPEVVDAKVSIPDSRRDPPRVKRAAAVALLEHAVTIYSNADATMLLAEMHLYKRMFHSRNVTAAVHYYTLLANHHGNATAQRVLGLMYATAVGVKRDYAKALLYMSFAALGDDLIAHQTLGYWHSVGIATAKSCEDSVWHYKVVADKVMETFRAGPPGGRTNPSAKIRLTETQGGVFGPGASGPGAPNKHLPQSAEAQRSVREIFEITAEEGDASVQLDLGNIYYTGTRHTRRNYKKAARYFLQAAKAFVGKRPQGEMVPAVRSKVAVASLAAGFLGTMYWRGEGVKKDEVLARQWFERGEELGNGMSLNGLGMMILEGAGGFEVDYKKALQYFTDAIQKDYADAYVNMAELTLKIGKPDALATAFKYYQTAATKPPASALTLYRLGEFHSQGLGNTPRQCTTALGYYKSLVERADWHDPTIRRAFEHFSRGEESGNPSEMDSAFLLYLFAAERGHEVAQTNAAWMIDAGLVGVGAAMRLQNVTVHTAEGGVQVIPDASDPVVGGELEIHGQDMYEVALISWNRAANQGNVDARVKMGDYHYYGLGLKAFEALDEDDGTEVADGEGTRSTGKRPRTVATQTGLWGAFQKLLRPYLSKHDATLSEPRYDKAALYYQVAADESSALAQWNVGYMHENGIGVTKDFPLAKRMYDLSLATNPEAYLAVNLALAKLNFKTRTETIEKLVKYYFSMDFVRDMLKKYHIIEEFEEFEVGEGEHIKGAIPASADEHLQEIGGKAVKIPGNTAKDKLGGISEDAILVGVLAAVIGVLFLWRQMMPEPPAPVAPSPTLPPPVAPLTELATVPSSNGVADEPSETPLAEPLNLSRDQNAADGGASSSQFAKGNVGVVDESIPS